MDETIEQRRARIARQRAQLVAQRRDNETIEQRMARNLVEIRKAQMARAERDRQTAARSAKAKQRKDANELAKWTRYFENCSNSERQFWADRARKPKACQAAMDSLDLSPPAIR